MRRRIAADERGIVAGGEALMFGVLVFVLGSLIVLSGWSVVDAKIAVEAAAREAARAVVESPVADLDAGTADALAQQVAVDAMAAHRGPQAAEGSTWALRSVALTGQRVRCGEVTARVTIDVETVRLPLLGGGFGTQQIIGTHTERIEPYRSGLPVAPGGIQC